MQNLNQEHEQKESNETLSSISDFNRDRQVEGMLVEADSELTEVRDRVSALDRQLLALFAERYTLMRKIYDKKNESNLPIYVPRYEALKLHEAVREVKDPFLKAPSRALYKVFMQLSREAQYHRKVMLSSENAEWKERLARGRAAAQEEIRTLAILGAQDSAAAEAAEELFPGVRCLPFLNLSSSVEAVKEGRVDALVLPYSRMDREMTAYMMRFFRESSLYLTRSLTSSGHSSLMTTRTSSLAKIRRVLAHPILLRQCEDLIRKFGWDCEEVTEIRASAREVALRDDPTVAAIAPSDEAARNGLLRIESEIDARTTHEEKYLVFSRELRLSEKVNHMNLLLDLIDREGALHAVLQYISDRGYNVRRVETLDKSADGLRKSVMIDFALPYGDERVIDLFYQLREEQYEVHLIGWYERS